MAGGRPISELEEDLDADDLCINVKPVGDVICERAKATECHDKAFKRCIANVGRAGAMAACAGGAKGGPIGAIVSAALTAGGGAALCVDEHCWSR